MNILVAEKASAFKSSLLAGLPIPNERAPEARAGAHLPAGTIVVSTDSHWSLGEDIFHDEFPEHLRHLAPRVVVSPSGAFDLQVEGKTVLPSATDRIGSRFDGVPGASQMKPRMEDLSAEGVDKELVFGNAVLGILAYPNAEVREWTFRIYNRYLARLQDEAPGRFYGVGIPNFWDMSKVRESVEEIKSLGLKTLQLPINAYSAEMTVLNYCDPAMEPMWQAIADSGLPICFHIGELFKDGPGAAGTMGMVNFGPFRKNLGELIFGGIFDRHPSLRVVFVEADINWIPGALQTATMVYDAFDDMLEPKLQHPPEYYWRTNCYATIMNDPVGLRLLDLVGADRVMWGGDYPHAEGMFGKGWSSISEIVDAVPEGDARMMLGGTALEVFDL